MSNLLEKASIVLTPTAYSDGMLHSVKPVQTFGSELITNGDFATDSNWSKGTGWTISGGTAVSDGSNTSGEIIAQTMSIVSGKTYQVVLDVKEVTSGNVRFYSNFLGGGGQANINSSGIFTYNLVASATGDKNVGIQALASSSSVINSISVKEVIDADFDFTRGSTATRENSSGNIESVAANLPRIDYLGGTGHILLEPQSTNLVTYSEDFNLTSTPSSGTGSQNNATTTPSSLPSPDGGTSAFTFIYDGTFNASIRKSVTLAADQAFTMSIFIKKTADTPTFSADDKIQIGIFNNVVSPVSLNLGNALNAATIGEWVRYSVTATADPDGGNCFPNLRCDVAARIDVFGWQLEQQSFPTSYIPTSGSTVTRSADEANNAGSSDLINSTEGVLYAEIAALSEGQPVTTLTISDGSLSNRVLIALTTGELRGQFVSSANNIAKTTSGVTIEEFNKIACSYTSTTFKVFVNGTELGTTSTSLTAVTGLNELAFDRGDGGLDFVGKVKCVAVFKEALTDAQLAALTS